MARPTAHECKIKLRNAKQYIEAGNFEYADFNKAAGEIFDGLELDDAAEVAPLVLELLGEWRQK